jgi:coenzyme F420 hydrogenase subunit beta
LESNNISTVVKDNLCTRCGACAGVCPSGALRWDDRYFPYPTGECTSCGLCLKVCGGIEVDFTKYAQRLYGRNYDLTQDAIGPVRYSFAAYSTDAGLRKRSSSGGLVSQMLISLLNSGEINGAVVCGMSSDDPLVPRAFMARTSDEIIAASQSKYSIFPVSHLYAEIIKTAGKYAIVGLPCQIHSLFRWQEIQPVLEERIVVVVGLFCHSNLERDAVIDLLRVNKVKSSDIERIEFRGGQWPGQIIIRMKDGHARPLHRGDIKDGVFNYLNKLYIADRCLVCTDYSSELSDIAVADPWLRDEEGEYLFRDGWSVGHIRTARGDLIIRQVIKSGSIVTKDIDRELIDLNSGYMTQHKKRGSFIRIKLRKLKGQRYPEYHLTFPRLGVHDYISEVVMQISLVGRHFSNLRYFLLKLALSSVGWRFTRFRSQMKKRAFKVRHKHKQCQQNKVS